MSLEKQIVDIIKKANEEMRLADKRAKQLYLASGGGAIPIGAIIPYLGGYFTDGNNGGFTMVIAAANTVVAVNALLNPDGFYVCDGAALNHASSPIWNAADRYLPKLTDDRFIQGDTVAGGTGGENANSHTHGVGSYAAANESSHTHSVTSNVTVTAHGITQPAFTGPSHRHSTNLPDKTSGAPSDTALVCITNAEYSVATATHTHDHDHAAQDSSYNGTGACTRTTSVALSNNHNVTNNLVTSGAGSTHGHELSGSSAAPSDTENRPKFLSCFYIVRAF